MKGGGVKVPGLFPLFVSSTTRTRSLPPVVDDAMIGIIVTDDSRVERRSVVTVVTRGLILHDMFYSLVLFYYFAPSPGHMVYVDLLSVGL